MSGASRPQGDGGGDGGGGGDADGARPLTAMSASERQFVDAVRPMTSSTGGGGGGRPQTGVRPPSGFAVTRGEGEGSGGGQGSARPKTSRSRMGSAVGNRTEQVEKGLPSPLFFPPSRPWKTTFLLILVLNFKVRVLFFFLLFFKPMMDSSRPFSRGADRPGSSVMGRSLTSSSGRLGTARGVPGTASRLVATAMQNRPASRGGTRCPHSGAADVANDVVGVDGVAATAVGYDYDDGGDFMIIVAVTAMILLP